jgi:ADP-ribose pyrophosphatase
MDKASRALASKFLFIFFSWTKKVSGIWLSLSGNRSVSSGNPESGDSGALEATICAVYQSREKIEAMTRAITHYKGSYLSLIERDGWEFASRSNASGVVVLVPVTAAGEIVLVEQFRKPVGSKVIELPAGLVGDNADPDESILDAAGRELEEETGYSASSLEVLMMCPSSAGMSDEIVSFVMASGLERTGPGGGDESEDIEVHVIPLQDVDGWLKRQQAEGKPLDPKIYAALYWLNSKSG